MRRKTEEGKEEEEEEQEQEEEEERAQASRRGVRPDRRRMGPGTGQTQLGNLE